MTEKPFTIVCTCVAMSHWRLKCPMQVRPLGSSDSDSSPSSITSHEGGLAVPWSLRAERQEKRYESGTSNHLLFP
jgi:hypothetical protein